MALAVLGSFIVFQMSMTIFVLLGSFSVQSKLITELATSFKKYILLLPEMGLILALLLVFLLVQSLRTYPTI